MKVYIDTNAWLRCAALRIDLWKEAQRIVPGKAEIVTLDKVVKELQGLRSASGTLALEAKLALAIVQQKNVTLVPVEGDLRVDDALVAMATESDFVLTQDQDLKRRLKAKGVGVITIRKDSHLALENREAVSHG